MYWSEIFDFRILFTAVHCWKLMWCVHVFPSVAQSTSGSNGEAFGQNKVVYPIVLR